MPVYKISEMQPIGSPYVKLPENGNKPKPQTHNETTKDITKIKWLEVWSTVKIIVQNYNKTLF